MAKKEETVKRRMLRNAFNDGELAQVDDVVTVTVPKACPMASTALRTKFMTT